MLPLDKSGSKVSNFGKEISMLEFTVSEIGRLDRLSISHR